jgi:tRNA-dihydrouridine synthase
MIGRRIYDNPMFLNQIEKEIYNNNETLSRQSILKKYFKYVLSLQNKNISNYLLLRHLFSLYYNTSSSKKWKKFLHDIIQSDKDIELITNFKESTYDEEIKAYR